MCNIIKRMQAESPTEGSFTWSLAALMLAVVTLPFVSGLSFPVGPQSDATDHLFDIARMDQPSPGHAGRTMQVQYVIVISIDGLRPDAITTLGSEQVPNLYRFRNEGAWTDHARTDLDYTLTLPNHTTMLTARQVALGVGHNWTTNSDPAANETIHSNKGSYVASVFDVAHDYGLRTGAYVSKSKFVVYKQSYNAANGAPDVTGPDNGKDKIDYYRYDSNTYDLTADFISAMRSDPFHFSLLHLRDPDAEGHSTGWMERRYLGTIWEMDLMLGNLFDLVENDPALNGNTVIILTSDHGGTGTGHSNPATPEHYKIPFYVWGAGVADGADLYTLNSGTRLDPGSRRPTYSASLPPVRNGDAANLALSLLGLPAIPGSTINADEMLAVDGSGTQLPVARFTATPTSGNLPLHVAFDASTSTDVDGTVVGYEWDFGDGASSSGMTANHTYTDAGEYTVTLTVTDDFGATGTLTETVAATDPNVVIISFQDGVAPTSAYSGTRDTNIQSDRPTTIFGSDDELKVDGDPDRSVLLKWDLTSLPAGSTVQSAEITLEIFDESPDTYEIYEMQQDWVEDEANWDQYRTGDSWQTEGAGGVPDRGSDVLGTILATDTGLLTIRLTDSAVSVIEKWIADPSVNYGFILQDYTSADNGTDFYSREASNASERPKLTLNFTPPGGNRLPVADFTATPTSGNSPLLVTFDASASSDADGTIVSYAWDFGDGALGSGLTANHTYTDAGEYDVILSVTDDAGATGMVSETIVVSDPNAVTISFQDGVAPTSAYSGTRDTEIASDEPTTNFGSADEMEVDGAPDHSALLKWDLNSVPPGSAVQSAAITLELFDGSLDTIEIYEMRQDWEEDEATWNQYRTGGSWQTEGAGGVPDRGSDVLGTILATDTGPFTITLTNSAVTVIENWINDPSINYGFILQDYTDASDGIDLHSREANNVSNRPKLTLTFAPPGGNLLPVARFTAMPTSGNSPLFVTFDASASRDADGTIARYAWDFGDGVLGSGVTANHTYMDAGEYPVTLLVTDDDGATGMVTETIVVSDPNAVTVSFQDGVAPTSDYSGTRDTKIKSDEPTTIFGSDDELELDGDPDRSVLLKWDLSSLPAGSTIQSATITLEIFDVSPDTYEIYEMQQDWVEDEANWNQYRTGDSWQTEGAEGAPDRGLDVLGTILASDVGPLMITLSDSAVSVIEKWIADPSVNYGFILQNYTSADNGIDFDSRETSNVRYRPKLTLTFAPPGSNQLPVARFTASPTSGNLPLSVAFDASASSDGDGTIVSYAWDFGDGALGSGVTANHTYTNAGEYAVTLSVTDDAGAAGMVTETIVVSDPNAVAISFQDGVAPTSAYSGTRDSKIKSDNPTTIFGSDDELEVNGDPDRSVLLKWDLSSLPAGSIVQLARITLQISDSSPDSYEIYEMQQDWVEGEANWNQYRTGDSWQTEGAGEVPDRSSDVLGTILATDVGPLTITLSDSAVSVISKWIVNPSVNYGFILQNYTSADDGIIFGSREAGNVSYRPRLTLTYIINTAVEDVGETPGTMEFSSNYPNPFHSGTKLRFELLDRAEVNLQVVDLLGRTVATLVEGSVEAGVHEVSFDAGGLPSGVYLARLRAGSITMTRKMVLHR